MTYKIYDKEKLREAYKKIIDQFLNGQLIETIEKSYLRGSDLPSDHWSLMNKILMALEGTKDARTWKAWNMADRWLKPNAKRFYIIAPYKITIEEKDEVTGEIIAKYQKLIGFRPQEEVKYEDTYGSPIEYVETPRNLPKMEEIAKKFNVSLKVERSSSGEWGSYNPVTKTVTMCTNELSTITHEIAHHCRNLIVMKKSKGKKNILNDLDRKKEEIIAEFSAQVLMDLFNLESDIKDDKKRLGGSLKYLKHWSGAKTTDELIDIITELIYDIEDVLDLALKIENGNIKTEKLLTVKSQ